MKRIYSWLKNLARFINFTRLFIVNTFFLIVVLLVVIAINFDDQKVKIADNSTLHLNFTGSIVEQKQPVDFSSELSRQMFAANQPQTKEYQIDEILQVIRYAQHDPRIKNILLELDGLKSAALNHLTDIGKHLMTLKQREKQLPQLQITTHNRNICWQVLQIKFI